MLPSEFKQIMRFIGQNVALCFSAALHYHEKTVENWGLRGQNEWATVENEAQEPGDAPAAAGRLRAWLAGIRMALEIAGSTGAQMGAAALGRPPPERRSGTVV